MKNQNIKNPHIYIQPVICQPRRKLGFNFDKTKKLNYNNYKLINQKPIILDINKLNGEYINNLKTEQKEIDDKKKADTIINQTKNHEKINN